MTIYCLLKRENTETPVELFVDTKNALDRMKALEEEGETAMTIETVEL